MHILRKILRKAGKSLFTFVFIQSVRGVTLEIWVYISLFTQLHNEIYIFVVFKESVQLKLKKKKLKMKGIHEIMPKTSMHTYYLVMANYLNFPEGALPVFLN